MTWCFIGSVRRLLYISEDFGTNYNVIFNSEKTKCVTFNPTKYVVSKISTAAFSVDGKSVENVTQWHYLGRLISAFHVPMQMT